jgi:hypothetical protein
MTDHHESSGDHPSYEPDFVLPRQGVIREDNWPEFAAQGFRPVTPNTDYARRVFGVEHVYTGDAFDYDEQRPLRHKPGIGVYVDAEGLELARERRARRKSQSSSEPGPPATS